MAVKPKSETAESADEQPVMMLVRQAFVIEVGGVPVVYRKGEPVDPRDPVLKSRPAEFFEPFAYPHPQVRA